MKKKIIIYQLLPRLFSNTNDTCKPSGSLKENGVGKFNDITSEVLKSIKELGITHVWYTGVIEHATKTDYSAFGIKPDNPHVVKGEAGSPYAIKDYYDVDPDLACDVDNRMAEFEALVRRTHKAGMKVVMDFVPNHTARCYNSDAKPIGIKDFGEGDNVDFFFSPSNNYYYITNQAFAPNFDLGSGNDKYIEFPAKATGDDCFSAMPGVNNWYETVKLNYGRDPFTWETRYDPVPDTWEKMLHILCFWASKGVDAFRCDMAFMVPLEFWSWVIAGVKELFPKVKFIAELYDTGIYRDFIFKGGFDYLYDKVNLYDTLKAIQCCNTSASSITNCWQAVEGIAPNMLNFLENHDEQRFGSEFFAGDPKLVIPSLVISAMISTGPMMIYMGQEIGERACDAEGFSGKDGRTTIFDYWSVETLRRWFNNGHPDNSLLTPEERELRETYSRILNLCNSEKAISEGSFFDLMYVNYDNPSFDPHRQYAFLRSYEGETLLIAVNFSDRDCNMDLFIPAHAFNMLGLPEGETRAKELLTGEKLLKQFRSTAAFSTSIKAHGAVIWKIKSTKVSTIG